MPRSFKLLRTLGEGAFGAVHLAEVRDEATGFVQTLAVKWLHPQFSGDEDLAGRLRDEARILALLRHDNVVRVHGITWIDGRMAILMEAVEGRDLSKMEGEPVPARAAIQVVEAVADALDAAWQTIPAGESEPMRVVHRDIKPSNIMVTSRGAVKVMDFGVARATFDAREASTRSQQFGTARYMAPERWMEGTSGPKSDVYSLGITLIELFSAKPVERPRLSRQGFEEDIVAAVGRMAEWPEAAELARHMCQREPEDRPTAAEVSMRCRDLADRIDGTPLRTWAPLFCEELPRVPTDELDGTEVLEDVSGDTFVTTGGIDATAPVALPTDDEEEERRTPVGFALLAGFVLTFGCLGLTLLGPLSVTAPAPPRPAPTQVEPALRAPEPSPEPLSRPEPTPEPPAPRVVQPSPVPQPVPVAQPDPRPAAPQVPYTFILDPPSLAARTRDRAIRHRTAVVLPANTNVTVFVDHDGETQRCTIPVGDATATYRVSLRAGQLSCRKDI